MSTDKIPSVANFDDAEIVSAARQLLSRLPANKVSAKTKAGYEREFQRLRTGAKTPAEIWNRVINTTSPRTYYRRLAALKDGMRDVIEAALSSGRIGVLRAILTLNETVEMHRDACPLENPKRRHSKRQDMRGLPQDWREMVLGCLRAANSQYQRAFLIAAVAGCRLAELQSGVTVAAKNGVLTLRIRGAKVKASQGQPWREIDYVAGANAHPLVAALYLDIVSDQAGTDLSNWQAEVRIEKPSSLCSAIRRAAKRLWPLRRKEITAYCLRHQAASDWKATLPEVDVSLALGHLSPDTKRLYGQAQMSKGGGLIPTAVRAERQLRRAPKRIPRPGQRS